MRRTRTNVPKGYDSWLEWDLAQELTGCEYHSETISYTIPHTYHPDFIYRDGKKTYFIEAKGRFRESAEARKYVHVREELSKDQELVFVFSNPKVVMPNARVRQDGTKRTVAEWADSHGFTWYSKHSTPKEWKQ